MAGVGPALVAHHQIGALGEHVDDLALALVAPLGADDDDAVCLRSEHGSPEKNAPRGGALEYPLAKARSAGGGSPNPRGPRPPACVPAPPPRPRPPAPPPPRRAPGAGAPALLRRRPAPT